MRKLWIVSALLFVLTACGVDKTAGTVGDGHYVSQVFPGLAHVEGSWASRLDVPVLYLLGK